MNRAPHILLLLLVTLALPGCELVGDLLAAGFWAGVIVLALGIALIVWIFKKIF